MGDHPGRDMRDARLRPPARVTEILKPRAQPLAAQQLGQPLGRAVSFGHEDDPPPVREPPAHVCDHARGIAAVRLSRSGFHPERGALTTLAREVMAEGRGAGRGVRCAGVVGGEGGDRPPGQPSGLGHAPDLGNRPERRRAQVDGNLPAGRCVHPGRLEELLAGADELGRAGPDPLRIAGQHAAAGRHVVEQQLHPLGQHWRERLHALDGDALGELAEHVRQSRPLVGQLLSPVPHRGGQQQLPARRRPQTRGGALEAALVGHPEEPDLLDGVAEELDPQRVLLGGREDVEDAAAHGQLAALLHQIAARVPDLHEPAHQIVEVGGLAFAHPDRLELAEPADHRLEQAAHRGGDDR